MPTITPHVAPMVLAGHFQAIELVRRTSLFLLLRICLSVCLSACLSASLSVCLSVCFVSLPSVSFSLVHKNLAISLQIARSLEFGNHFTNRLFIRIWQSFYKSHVYKNLSISLQIVCLQESGDYFTNHLFARIWQSHLMIRFCCLPVTDADQ